jgi:hypothetical protein
LFSRADDDCWRENGGNPRSVYDVRDKAGATAAKKTGTARRGPGRKYITMLQYLSPGPTPDLPMMEFFGLGGVSPITALPDTVVGHVTIERGTCYRYLPDGTQRPYFFARIELPGCPGCALN